jgi:hypothetical protein
MVIDISPTSGIQAISLTEKFDARPGYLLLALSEYVSDLDGLKQTGLRKYLDRATVDVQYTDDETGIGRLNIQPYDTNDKGELVDLKITCQPFLWNWAKAAICDGTYVDVALVPVSTAPQWGSQRAPRTRVPAGEADVAQDPGLLRWPLRFYAHRKYPCRTSISCTQEWVAKCQGAAVRCASTAAIYFRYW